VKKNKKLQLKTTTVRDLRIDDLLEARGGGSAFCTSLQGSGQLTCNTCWAQCGWGCA